MCTKHTDAALKHSRALDPWLTPDSSELSVGAAWRSGVSAPTLRARYLSRRTEITSSYVLNLHLVAATAWVDQDLRRVRVVIGVVIRRLLPDLAVLELEDRLSVPTRELPVDLTLDGVAGCLRREDRNGRLGASDPCETQRESELRLRAGFMPAPCSGRRPRRPRNRARVAPPMRTCRARRTRGARRCGSPRARTSARPRVPVRRG